MRKLLNYIKSLFIATNWEEKYLSQSVDHYDLERRQRALNNGTITDTNKNTVTNTNHNTNT